MCGTTAAPRPFLCMLYFGALCLPLDLPSLVVSLARFPLPRVLGKLLPSPCLCLVLCSGFLNFSLPAPLTASLTSLLFPVTLSFLLPNPVPPAPPQLQAVPDFPWAFQSPEPFFF